MMPSVVRRLAYTAAVFSILLALVGMTHAVAQQDVDTTNANAAAQEQQQQQQQETNTNNGGGEAPAIVDQYSRQHRFQPGHADAAGAHQHQNEQQQQQQQQEEVPPPPPPRMDLDAMTTAQLHEVTAKAIAASAPYTDLFRKVRLRIPLEIVSVHGCKDSTKPRRGTSGCVLDGSVRLTIRGRGFQANLGGVRGSTAWLVESGFVGNVTKPPAHGSAAAGGRDADDDATPTVPIVRIPCEGLEYSPDLPDLVAYCKLPDVSLGLTDDERAAMSSMFRSGKHNTYHLQLISGDGAQTSILREAVTIAKKAVKLISTDDGAKEDGMGGSGVAAKANSDSDDDDTTEEDEVLDATLQAAVASGNWKALGIGGLDKQFSELFRRAFSTRSGKASELVSTIGIQHIKGVILHGPPGTGKTLAARMLAKLLHAKDVTIVNGPEIMSKYVGDSEKNLRELFSPAMAEYKRKGDRAGLYVIVFDEVDAILRPRGAGDDGSSAKALYDGVTTQLLSYMDGVHSAPNVLVVGLTNRLDALDKALLRPGRFEVQIRMHLPDKKGREEILWVHTQTLRDNQYLAPDVNLVQLAEDTISFSGADIAGMVRSAISFALERHTEKAASSTTATGNSASANAGGEESCGGSGTSPCTADAANAAPLPPSFLGDEAKAAAAAADNNPTTTPNGFAVYAKDFRRAVKEILAARSSGSGLQAYMGRGVVQYSKAVGTILRNINRMAQALIKGSSSGRGATVGGTKGNSGARAGLAHGPRVSRFAITGPRGSGKTAIAALAARNARYATSFVISPETLHGLSPTEKVRKINDVFDTATHTPSAVVLIDDCDTIIELIGGKGNLNIVVALRALIHRDLSKVAVKEDSDDNKLLIITTSTSEEVFQHLGLYQFDGHAMLADLSRGAAANVLYSYHVFGSSPTPASRQLAINAARHLPPRVPIKRLMFFIDQVRAAADVDVAALPAPLSDLTEHPLFPSLWATDSEDEAGRDAAEASAKATLAGSTSSGAKKQQAAKLFDPFAPKEEDTAAPSNAASDAHQQHSGASVAQFSSVLAQFHSYYSNTNVDFVVEDLTPV